MTGADPVRSDVAQGEVLRDTERELVDVNADVRTGSIRRVSCRSSGISSQKRDTGLYEGAPQDERIIARVM